LAYLLSVTPDISQCVVAPPNVSLSTTSPTEDFTKYEPAKKTEPVPSTINAYSDIIGRYAPPATQEPIMAEICGIPMDDILALLRKIRPKCSLSGKISSCIGR